MMYVRIWADTPYCGTDAYKIVAYPDDTEEKVIEEDCEDFGLANADSFEYLATGWNDFEGTDEEYDEIIEDYRADCEWGYEVITKEEFERLRSEGY